MSIPGFGRITYVQGLMLGLIGYSITRGGATLDIPDKERIQNMRQARDDLVELTGQDFGYDLKLWRQFLSQHDDYEYTHPYAYSAVKKAVIAAQVDGVRKSLLDRLEERSLPDRDSKRMFRKAQRLIEKYTQPNPPRMGPPVASDEGIQEVWRWAEAWGHIHILSALALPMCSLVQPDEREQFYAKLQKLAQQCETAQKQVQRADFYIAMARLQSNSEAKQHYYQSALQIYSQQGEWSGEAYCVHCLADIYRVQQQWKAWQDMELRAFLIWAQHDHKRGMGASLLFLSEILERAGEFQQACQLLYRAKTLLSSHITHITARDLLKRVSHEKQIPPTVYETDTNAQELVSEFFDLKEYEKYLEEGSNEIS